MDTRHVSGDWPVANTFNGAMTFQPWIREIDRFVRRVRVAPLMEP